MRPLLAQMCIACVHCSQCMVLQLKNSRGTSSFMVHVSENRLGCSLI